MPPPTENRLSFYVFCLGVAGSLMLTFLRRRSEKAERELSIAEQYYPGPSCVPSSFRLFAREDLSTLPPNLLIALWELNEIRGDEIPEIAIALLQRDFDTPALRRLAGEEKPTRVDVDGLVRRVFAELNAPIPETEDDAKVIISRYFAEKAISDEMDVYEVCDKIAYLHHWDFISLAGQIVSINLDAEGWGEDERAENKSEMLDACRNYLEATAPSSTLD